MKTIFFIIFNEFWLKFDQLIKQSTNPHFQALVQVDEKAKKCTALSKLLEYCYSRSPNMGFLLLYYLKVHSKLAAKKNEKAPAVFKSNVYKLFYQWINPKAKDQIEACLQKDLTLMEQYSLNMFLWLVPDVYREFEAQMVNNSEVLRTIVGCIDAKNLRDLVFDITQGKLKMFSNEGVLEVLRESLEYETFEQICLWQLLTAHDVPISYIQVSSSKFEKKFRKFKVLDQKLTFFFKFHRKFFRNLRRTTMKPSPACFLW